MECVGVFKMPRKYYVFVRGAIVYETTDELVAYEYARLCRTSDDGPRGPRVVALDDCTRTIERDVSASPTNERSE